MAWSAGDLKVGVLQLSPEAEKQFAEQELTALAEFAPTKLGAASDLDSESELDDAGKRLRQQTQVRKLCGHVRPFRQRHCLRRFINRLESCQASRVISIPNTIMM
jgi:hypothetical protein